MVIKEIEVVRFRAFENVSLELGKNITLIAGQNGTQKSTLLGMLTQPFSISDKSHPLYGEAPLSGGTYKSSFQDKFRLSDRFDSAKEHEWTLHFRIDEEPFTVESINRDKSKGTIRFWKKGSREKGSGYIQLPVIFLSLKRLLPIGEELKLQPSESVKLTEGEAEDFERWYNEILISRDDVKELSYLESSHKQTLGVNTSTYDWNSNSAGQDNISKILMAVISFRRLKEKYGDDFGGGILAIDEIDATLYPGSQVKLFHRLISLSSKYNFQVIATTHSLPLIKEAYSIYRNEHRKNQVNVGYLKRIDGRVSIYNHPEYDRIEANLNVALSQKQRRKIDIFTEDSEGIDFIRAVLGQRFSVNYQKVTLGCGNYISLAKNKVPSFIFPNSIIVLDGDSKKDVRRSGIGNIVCLPGDDSPERLLAAYLSNLSDDSPFWTEKNLDYTKQVCFRDYSLSDILSSRTQAKAWYRAQKEIGVWGRGAALIYKYYLATVPEEKERFLTEFESLYRKIESAL